MKMTTSPQTPNPSTMNMCTASMNGNETEMNESLVCTNAFMQLQAMGQLLTDGYAFQIECFNSSSITFLVFAKKDCKTAYYKHFHANNTNTHQKLTEQINQIWQELNARNLVTRNS